MASSSHEPKLSLQRRLAAAIGLAAAAAAAEILGSALSGSLALLSDAGHVGTDAIALGLSLAALRVSGRPHTPRMSFGWHRTEVLAALLNALLLLGLGTFLLVQAYGRYLSPPAIAGGTMFVVGFAGLGANLMMLVLLKEWARQNINARGAFLHAYGDTLGSAGVVVAAGLIQATGDSRFDVVVAVLIVGLIYLSAARLLRDTLRIVMEASPAGMAPGEVAAVIAQVPGVRGVHDLHIWTVTSGLLALTGHVVVSGEASVQEAARIVDAINVRLRERFGIAHATLQVDSIQDELIPASEVARRAT